MLITVNKQRAELTFKDNLKRGRHGWLRLTPAYSVQIVEAILNEHPHIQTVLDPFGGTGTTGLVCAERGLAGTVVDINPFLVWLAEAKTRNYDDHSLLMMQNYAAGMAHRLSQPIPDKTGWIPSISHPERWWRENRLVALARLFHEIGQVVLPASELRDLLYMAFCRVMMDWSEAAFNHQSMSFKSRSQQHDFFTEADLYGDFQVQLSHVIQTARSYVSGPVTVQREDARYLTGLPDKHFDAVITSPPYANRMSYIRELRPYMYWLGFLNQAREAGELDWQAIGGTWGIATSRLNTWNAGANPPCIESLKNPLEEISRTSELLSKYVHKYFVDISMHFDGLRRVLKSGASLFYIVGNSKFYDTMIHTEQIYAELLQQQGYNDVCIRQIRKRNSKKELYEFIVSCRY